MIRFNDEPVRFGDGEKAELDALLAQADRKIREKNGEGNDFLGWIDLPDNYDREELKRIQAAGDRIAESSDVLIVIGIGGSYLGAKAALDFLRSPYYNSTDSRRRADRRYISSEIRFRARRSRMFSVSARVSASA